MNDRRVLALGVETMEIGVSQRKSVTMIFPPPSELGMSPDLLLGVDLTPAEARQIAKALHSKADEAEA